MEYTTNLHHCQQEKTFVSGMILNLVLNFIFIIQKFTNFMIFYLTNWIYIFILDLIKIRQISLKNK